MQIAPAAWSPDAPKVLLAEDEPAMRQLLARTLREQGFAVQEVENGAALLHALAREDEEPGLIITDLHMPGATGLEVLSRLLLSEWSVPVIVITAFGDSATLLEARRLGASSVLSKPFALEALVSAARALVTP